MRITWAEGGLVTDGRDSKVIHIVVTPLVGNRKIKALKD